MKDVMVLTRALLGLFLIVMGCFLCGCSDSSSEPSNTFIPISSAIDPPTAPTTADRDGAVLKPSSPSASDIKFGRMSIGTTAQTTMGNTLGLQPQIKLTIPDPGAPGGQQSQLLPMTQNSGNGNIVINQQAILPPGQCKLELEPNTRIYFESSPTTNLALRTQAVRDITLKSLVIEFLVNPVKNGRVSWTLPTAINLKLKKLDSGECILNGSQLTVYFDGLTSLPPVSHRFEATVNCYDAHDVLRDTVYKRGTIDSQRYGYIIPLSNRTFSSFDVYLKFLD